MLKCQHDPQPGILLADFNRQGDLVAVIKPVQTGQHPDRGIT